MTEGLDNRKYEERHLQHPMYDQNGDEEQEIDLLIVEGESLVVRRIMTTPKIEKPKGWRRHSIFRTKVNCGGRVCNLILDNGSSENIVSKEIVETLKLPMEKHPDPYKLAWFRRGTIHNT